MGHQDAADEALAMWSRCAPAKGRRKELAAQCSTQTSTGCFSFWQPRFSR